MTRKDWIIFYAWTGATLVAVGATLGVLWGTYETREMSLTYPSALRDTVAQHYPGVVARESGKTISEQFPTVLPENVHFVGTPEIFLLAADGGQLAREGLVYAFSQRSWK